MSRFILLFLNSAILTACAVFVYDERAFVLTLLMLFLPFLDKRWQLPVINFHLKKIMQWLAIATLSLALVWQNPQQINMLLIMLLFTALPEEWFFRAYVQTRLEQSHAVKNGNNIVIKKQWQANLATSVFFALIHMPIQGWYGLMVLFPSLVFGFLYQKNRDIVLVVLLHALSNLVFIIYIRDLLWQKIVF